MLTLHLRNCKLVYLNIADTLWVKVDSLSVLIEAIMVLQDKRLNDNEVECCKLIEASQRIRKDEKNPFFRNKYPNILKSVDSRKKETSSNKLIDFQSFVSN